MVTAEQRAIMEAAVAHDGAQRSLGAVWRALQEVADPEIPIISIVELGIVRAVEWDASEGDALVVHLTPTYSGCPATTFIVSAIRERMEWLGVSQLRIETRLAPAWTTDWITPEGERKLRAYGIAPPAGKALAAAVGIAAKKRIDVAGISPLRRAESAVACPRCDSLATRLVSQFGSTACKAQYRCDDCREPFDYFKPH